MKGEKLISPGVWRPHASVTVYTMALAVSAEEIMVFEYSKGTSFKRKVEAAASILSELLG